MNIAIDIRCLVSKELTGVGEYTLQLLKKLLPLDNINNYYLFYNSSRDVSANIPKFDQPNVHYVYLRWPNKLLNLSLTLFKYPKLDKLIGAKSKEQGARNEKPKPNHVDRVANHVDQVATPNPVEINVFFFPNIGFFSVSCPYIITAHDISFEFFQEFLSLKRKLWHKVINPRQKFLKAEKVIAVSQNTASDLINHYGLPREKVTAIHSAISEKYKPLDKNSNPALAIKQKYNLPEKFILFLGTIEPRKNVETLIDAFQILKKQAGFDYSLVLAGKLGWKTNEIRKKIATLDDIIMTGFIPEEEKPYIYNLASLFVYPSYYEGFGFPPLEAMACGVPVITSCNSSLTEICADAAMYVEPHNINDLVFAIQKILQPETVKYYRNKGPERAKTFSWNKTAADTLHAIEKNQ